VKIGKKYLNKRRSAGSLSGQEQVKGGAFAGLAYGRNSASMIEVT